MRLDPFCVVGFEFVCQYELLEAFWSSLFWVDLKSGFMRYVST